MWRRLSQRWEAASFNSGKGLLCLVVGMSFTWEESPSKLSAARALELRPAPSAAKLIRALGTGVQHSCEQTRGEAAREVAVRRAWHCLVCSRLLLPGHRLWFAVASVPPVLRWCLPLRRTLLLSRKHLPLLLPPRNLDAALPVLQAVEEAHVHVQGRNLLGRLAWLLKLQLRPIRGMLAGRSPGSFHATVWKVLREVCLLLLPLASREASSELRAVAATGLL
mmetsp:Transcript_20272/g.36043  ORF Transcript_20272/g.36043 Transcript_20272/m.36043 type:complete len:222 (+) Transcript_20272:1269-1934(+)